METAFFKWDKAYNTNIPVIDMQHKVIVKILNELYEVVLVNNEEEKMSDIINELMQYTIYHFEEEEKLFEKHNFKESKDHKKEHQKFINEIKSIEIKQKSGETFLAFYLINFLKDWLIDHILVSDQEYVKFFKQKNITF